MKIILNLFIHTLRQRFEYTRARAHTHTHTYIYIYIYIYIYKTVFNRVNPALGTIPIRTIRIFKNSISILSNSGQEVNAF